MTLSNSDIVDLIAFRHALHQQPEISGAEAETAATIAAALSDWSPDRILTGLGGHGVAAIYDSGAAGATVMFRAELDALPITEKGSIRHISRVPGTAHLCGHDGHMTILMALARLLHRSPPKRGKVVLLFQPAEETGAGAAALLKDPRFGAIVPDWAFAIHNMPGCPRGTAWLKPGIVNCASAGLRITLSGSTAHASLPETGRAPTPVLARLIDDLAALAPGGVAGPGFRLATITHLKMGEPAFGVAPGEAELWVTLRTLTGADLDTLIAQARSHATDLAARHDLDVAFSLHDHFHDCTNDPEATALLSTAAKVTGIALDKGDLPMRASEDFGRLASTGARTAMIYLGAGIEHPALHTETYDFPDDLISIGARLFDHVRRGLTG